MPDFYREWLSSLSFEQADELDEWMDSSPDIRNQTAQYLASVNPLFALTLSEESP